MQKISFQNLKNINENKNPQNMYPQVNFCPKCGTLLKLTVKDALSLNCPKCRFQKKLNQNGTAKQNVHSGRQDEIVVIDKNEESALRPLPTVKVICPSCGKGEREMWMVTVGGETAPSTITFFRGTTCGMTRRETG